MDETHPPSLAPCQHVAIGFALISAILGAIALVGWVLGLRALMALDPAFPRMSPMTAFWLIGAGISLILQIPEPVSRSRKRIARLLALGLLILGALDATQVLMPHLVWRMTAPILPWGAPRPAPNTALATTLAGLGLLGFDRRTRRGARPAELAAAFIGLVALLALVGYAYNARHLYAIPSYSALALNTALALLLLAGGMLCARPRTGATAHLLHRGAGGHMIRRVLPAAIAIPILLGELRAIGLQHDWGHSRLRLAVLTIGNVAALGIIIFRNGRSLNQLDDQRLIVEAKLRAANEVLETRVTERTEALQGEVRERQRAEEQSRHLLEASPDAMLILDGFARIVRINSRSEALFGHSRAELFGTPVTRWLTDYRDEPAGGPPTELTARGAQGRLIPVSIASSRIVHDDRLLIFLNVRDITERKRAETLSLGRERRFRAVADTANDAVVSANQSGRLIYVNPAALRIFGYEQQEMLDLSLEHLMPERYRDHHHEGMRHYIETGEGPFIGRSVELYGLRRGDIEFPLDLSLAAWVEEGCWYFTGIIRDISLRRESEERIANLNETLRRRASELETLNHELEAFSYSVSHDLRAPLRSIDGFSQAVLEDYGARLDDHGRDYLQRVRNAAQRMGRLIDDLLKLARVTRAELSLQPVDLSALAQDIGVEMASRYPDQPVAFEVRPGLQAEGDPALLRVALENLLDNAWKFSRGRAPARVEVGATEGGFFVLDNGVGFEPAYADRLFRPFSRLHDASTFPGTGIGLATVQRVVHKHGGTIEATSRPDLGTAFYIRLRPAATEPTYRATPTPPSGGVGG